MQSDPIILSAIETFVRGFAFTRSFTHPYLTRRIDSAWHLCDAPRTSGDTRNEEWIVQDLPAKAVDRLARTHSRGRFAISTILPLHAPDAALRAEYKALGYRLRATEALMVHPLQSLPRFSAHQSIPIEQVKSQPLADRLARAARSRQILPEHLADPSPPIRQYVALAGEKIVGWVRSIDTGKTTWCSNMFVLREFRRRGIGRAMLSRLLQDDQTHGSQSAILTASHTGAMLYPHLGYQKIATLYLLSPRS